MQTCPNISCESAQTQILVHRIVHEYIFTCANLHKMSQLMRFWYLSHRRSAEAQASLCIRTVSPEPSLFAHMNYGSRQRVRPNIRHLAPLDGCACVFEEWIYGGQKVPKSHELAQITCANLHVVPTVKDCYVWQMYTRIYFFFHMSFSYICKNTYGVSVLVHVNTTWLITLHVHYFTEIHHRNQNASHHNDLLFVFGHCVYDISGCVLGSYRQKHFE